MPTLTKTTFVDTDNVPSANCAIVFRNRPDMTGVTERLLRIVPLPITDFSGSLTLGEMPLASSRSPKMTTLVIRKILPAHGSYLSIVNPALRFIFLE